MIQHNELTIKPLRGIEQKLKFLQ